MELRTLSNRISYLPASDGPLSSDVGIISGDEFAWIFDVGSCDEALELIQGIPKQKKIILSHFHQDHIANLERITEADIYCGSYTKTKLQRGMEIRSAVTYNDGVTLTIFPIPSTHAKGAVGLEVNEEFAFLGDAVYAAGKNGRVMYNVGLLKETIVTLEGLKAQTFLLSHDSTFVQPKEKVLSELKELYRMRKPGESYLFLDT